MTCMASPTPFRSLWPISRMFQVSAAACMPRTSESVSIPSILSDSRAVACSNLAGQCALYYAARPERGGARPHPAPLPGEREWDALTPTLSQGEREWDALPSTFSQGERAHAAGPALPLPLGEVARAERGRVRARPGRRALQAGVRCRERTRLRGAVLY